MIRWLLDTGPLVAYLDHADPFHSVCADTLDLFEGRLLTTSAVVVEAMHLLGEARDGPQALVDFLVRSETEIRECTDPALLKKAAALMKKYRDLPMDFADATLTLLAQETGVTRIATLDHRGFKVFRPGVGKRFQFTIER